MVGEGVKVILLDSIDATNGAAIEAKAQAAGIDVIDYDRVNLGGTAPYYVSYDNEQVGELQAQTLVDCLGDAPKPQIIEMDGGKDVDNNAVAVRQGRRHRARPAGTVTARSRSSRRRRSRAGTRTSPPGLHAGPDRQRRQGRRRGRRERTTSPTRSSPS